MYRTYKSHVHTFHSDSGEYARLSLALRHQAHGKMGISGCLLEQHLGTHGVFSKCVYTSQTRLHVHTHTHTQHGAAVKVEVSGELMNIYWKRLSASVNTN